MEDSPIGLHKWLPIIGGCMVNCKNGISSYELVRTIGVTLKFADGCMLHRIQASDEWRQPRTSLAAPTAAPSKLMRLIVGGNRKEHAQHRDG